MEQERWAGGSWCHQGRLLSAVTFKLRWKDEETRRQVPGLRTDGWARQDPGDTSGRVGARATQESADLGADPGSITYTHVTLVVTATSELRPFILPQPHTGDRECLPRKGFGTAKAPQHSWHVEGPSSLPPPPLLLPPGWRVLTLLHLFLPSDKYSSSRPPTPGPGPSPGPGLASLRLLSGTCFRSGLDVGL